MTDLNFDFWGFLDRLRAEDNVSCPSCGKGVMVPVGSRETAHGFYCSHCKEKIQID